jgi:hypothetical protein
MQMQKNCNNRIKGSKAQVQCEQCNLLFIAKRGSMGRFCSLACKHEWVKHDKVNGKSSYINCCKCHASLGFGIVKSSQFVGKSKNSITNGLKSAGVVRYLPDGGSWRNYASKPNQLRMSWWGGDEIAELWMSDYVVEFPTWAKMAGIKKLDIYITKYLKDEHAVAKHLENAKNKNNESLRKYTKNRKIIDPGFKVKCNLRRRLKDVIVSTKKGGGHHVSSLIGCSTKQLAKHLESQFSKGMTWDNYGINGWHVDHVIPCAKFDHNDAKQIAQCWHWTNLQPLWAKENLTKSDNITNPQMNLMLGGMH